MELVLDGFEGWSYKPVHEVQLFEALPKFALVAELAQAAGLGPVYWRFESSRGYHRMLFREQPRSKERRSKEFSYMVCITK